MIDEVGGSPSVFEVLAITAIRALVLLALGVGLTAGLLRLHDWWRKR